MTGGMAASLKFFWFYLREHGCLTREQDRALASNAPEPHFLENYYMPGDLEANIERCSLIEKTSVFCDDGRRRAEEIEFVVEACAYEISFRRDMGPNGYHAGEVDHRDIAAAEIVVNIFHFQCYGARVEEVQE